MLPCSWKETFGIECPSCGAQRGFLELMAGHVWKSVILFPALLPLITVAVLTLLHLYKRSWVNPKWITRFFIFSAVLMFGNWMLHLFNKL